MDVHHVLSMIHTLALEPIIRQQTLTLASKNAAMEISIPLTVTRKLAMIRTQITMTDAAAVAQ